MLRALDHMVCLVWDHSQSLRGRLHTAAPGGCTGSVIRLDFRDQRDVHTQNLIYAPLSFPEKVVTSSTRQNSNVIGIGYLL